MLSFTQSYHFKYEFIANIAISNIAKSNIAIFQKRDICRALLKTKELMGVFRCFQSFHSQIDIKGAYIYRHQKNLRHF